MLPAVPGWFGWQNEQEKLRLSLTKLQTATLRSKFWIPAAVTVNAALRHHSIGRKSMRSMPHYPLHGDCAMSL